MALVVPLLDFVGDFLQTLLVLQKATVFKVVFRVAHVGQEEHHPDFSPEVLLRLHVLNLVLQRHRDERLVEPSDPWVPQCFLRRVPHLQVELGQPVEQVRSQRRQVLRELELVQGQELRLVLICHKLVRLVQRMLATSKEHVHDDSDSEHVDTRRILPFLDELWAHEDECTHLVCVVVLLVLRAQAEIGDLDRREIFWVAQQNIVRFQISVHNLVRVQIVDGLEDGLDDLGGLFIRKVDALLLPRQDKLGELATSHELHAQEDLALDLLELHMKQDQKGERRVK